MMSEKRLFGVRIKHLRKQRGLTQEKLAEKMSISSNYLSGLERGTENPTFDLLIRLSDALKVEMWELFDFKHESSQRELIEMMNKLVKEGGENQLRLAVKILKAIVR